MPAPIRWLRQRLFSGKIGEIGPMPFPCMHDVITPGPGGLRTR